MAAIVWPWNVVEDADGRVVAIVEPGLSVAAFVRAEARRRYGREVAAVRVDEVEVEADRTARVRATVRLAPDPAAVVSIAARLAPPAEPK